MVLALWAALGGSALAADHAPDDHDAGDERRIEVTVDLSDESERSAGWMSVEAVYHDLDRRDLRFRPLGSEGEFTWTDVAFEGADGPLTATYEAPFWSIDPIPESGPITVRYRVKPGGAGRHGHQGWVAVDWAAFDGRILFYPQTRRSIRTARYRLITPDGWTTLHPMTPVEDDGEWLQLHDHRYLEKMLAATCMATGTYEVRSRTFGETEVRVGAPSTWPEPHREVLFDKSFAMFDWFNGQLGYDRRAPFAIGWLPNGEKGKVFGGASVNGACYEHPQERARNWLLLGHRIGHPMNKYAPSGMTLRDDRDHWFMEGWASYIEVVAAARSGALPDERHWNVLWRRHLSELRRDPELDVPLARESESPEASEYLHYTKGPLVVKHLADLLQTRSGVTLEAFMRAMWEKYGFHRQPFPLREEIEQFTGDDYDDFWAVFVDQAGAPFPTWPEMVDPRLEARMSDPPAAYVGDTPIHPEYLFWLAWSGRFERYADIEKHLVDAVHQQAVLESRGLTLLPATVAPMQFALPGQAQAAIGQTAIDWDESALPRASGCWSQPDPPRPTIRYTDSEDGRTFARLLELERTYESQLGPMVGAVTARVPRSATRTGTRLGVSPGESFVVHTSWVDVPPRSGFELWAGGQNTKTKRLTMDPTWVNTHVTFEPDHRPSDASVLIVKVGGDSAPVADFPLWQRDAPFARGAPREGQDPR